MPKFVQLVIIFGLIASVVSILNQPQAPQAQRPPERHLELCNSNADCYNEKTLLYCINKRCFCLQNVSSSLTPMSDYKYNMEWHHNKGRCVSKLGSPCALFTTGDSRSSDVDCIDGAFCLSSSMKQTNSKIDQNPTWGLCNGGNSIGHLLYRSSHQKKPWWGCFILICLVVSILTLYEQYQMYLVFSVNRFKCNEKSI